MEIKVPPLGESITEATVGRWHKAVGEAVALDDILVELETDKITLEVNATAASRLDEIAAPEGENVCSTSSAIWRCTASWQRALRRWSQQIPRPRSLRRYFRRRWPPSPVVRGQSIAHLLMDEPVGTTSERSEALPCQLQLQGTELEQVPPKWSPRSSHKPCRVHRHQRAFYKARHGGAVRQGRQERDPNAPCPAVADHLTREADQDWSEGRAPQPLHRFPDERKWRVSRGLFRKIRLIDGLRPAARSLS